MFQTIISLKPQSQCPAYMTLDPLIAALDRRMRFPGMPNIWWMPIQTRNEMLSTGVRSAAAVKIYGDDLETLQRLSVAVEKALMDVPGTRSAYAERMTGAYFLDFDV